MLPNKYKSTISLQQVLDSILNNDPENYVSEEESQEEEFDYNDVVTKDGQSCSFLNRKFRFYMQIITIGQISCCCSQIALVRYLVAAAILSSLNTLKYSKSSYNAESLEKLS